jgi:putative tricarboxylic transport membrane protein
VIDPVIWLPVILGSAVGLIGGLLPGVGILTFTILFWSLLDSWTVIQCVAWFMSAVLTAQFVGSVVATHFGVLGETSSYPATIEGFRLFRQGQGPMAIRAAAIGSLVATVVALLIFSTIGIAVDWIAGWYRTVFQVFIITGVLIAVCFVSQERSWLSKMVQVPIGLALGVLGDNSMHDFTMDLGPIKVENSLPLIPLLVGIYALPNLIRGHHSIIHTITSQIQQRVQKFHHWWTAVWYSLVGFVLGLTPGLPTDIASNVSYRLQQYVEQLKGIYHTKGSVGCLTAAESANNSAAVSSMLPLLLFGVPITVSESLLYSIISAKGHVFSPLSFDHDIVINLLVGLTAVGVFSYVLSDLLSASLVKFYLWLKHKALFVIGTLLVLAVIWAGIQQYSLVEYVCTMLAGLCAAAVFRRTDFYVLIFAFAISRHAVENFIRLSFLL